MARALTECAMRINESDTIDFELEQQVAENVRAVLAQIESKEGKAVAVDCLKNVLLDGDSADAIVKAAGWELLGDFVRARRQVRPQVIW